MSDLKEEGRECNMETGRLKEQLKIMEAVKEDLKICGNEKNRLKKEQVDQQDEADREAKKVKSVNTEESSKALQEKEALEKSRDDLQVQLLSFFSWSFSCLRTV